MSPAHLMSVGQILDVVGGLCLLVGAALTLVAAIGIVRLPDMLSRMHAATKPQVLGLLLALLGLGLVLREPRTIGLLLLVALFQLITSPVASHMVGRASFRGGHMRSDLLVVDEISPPSTGPVPGGRPVGPESPTASADP
jgi:multicomponent Na+:H+ antiporter subunit G